jgi:hypothetical protein
MGGRGLNATWPLSTATALCGVLAVARLAAAEQVVLEPAEDNTIFDEGALSNGRGTGLFAGVTGGGDIRRALLAFGVAGAIPAGSTITDAQLSLRVTRSISGNQPMTVHRLLADWGEGASNSTVMGGSMGADAAPGDATWTFRLFDTTMWANEGGDFVATASATQQVGNSGSATWGSNATMVADVQIWLDTPAGDFGWIVIGDESARPTSKRFGSSEAGSANRPKLTIHFDPPAGLPTATPTVTPSASPTRTASPTVTVAAPSATAAATATATAESTTTATAVASTPTVTSRAAATATVTATLTVSPEAPTATDTPTRTPLACIGDCDQSGSVNINDLVRGVSIALGNQPIDACPAFDPSGSGTVEINELIAGVSNALNGCPA